jgi:hypothetical protein
MTRLIAALAALALAGGVAACSLIQAPRLTDDEWASCQGNWRDGLDPSQRDEPNGSTWYFDHMGMRDNPDTIRVCRAAAAKRSPPGSGATSARRWSPTPRSGSGARRTQPRDAGGAGRSRGPGITRVGHLGDRPSPPRGWEVDDLTRAAALDTLDVAMRVAVLDLEGLPATPGMRAAHRLVTEIAGLPPVDGEGSVRQRA